MMKKYFFKNTDIFAYISDKKELTFENEHYRISKLGGILSNKNTNVNGWEVWTVLRNGKKVPINHLKKFILKKNWIL